VPTVDYPLEQRPVVGILKQSTYLNADLAACATPQGITELDGATVLVVSPLPIP
jgi:hypothetical protein